VPSAYLFWLFWILSLLGGAVWTPRWYRAGDYFLGGTVIFVLIMLGLLGYHDFGSVWK
jgi:hypothetical protein